MGSEWHWGNNGGAGWYQSPRQWWGRSPSILIPAGQCVISQFLISAVAWSPLRFLPWSVGHQRSWSAGFRAAYSAESANQRLYLGLPEDCGRCCLWWQAVTLDEVALCLVASRPVGSVHTLMRAVCGGSRDRSLSRAPSTGIHHMPDHLHAASLLINMPEDII